MVERMTNSRYVRTTLAVALTGSTAPTTLTPASYTGFPATGQGTLTVGNRNVPASVEVVLVTDWATHPWPITRAADGSTALTHAIGDGVETVLSETSLGGLVGIYEGATLRANATEVDFDAADFDVDASDPARPIVALASSFGGTFTGTATPSTLNVPTGTTPAPTAEGEMLWDSDDDRLVIGTGSGTQQIATSGDLTGFGNATGGTYDHPTVSDYEDFTDQGGDPSSPGAGVHRVYAKSGGLYIKNTGGTVVGPFAAGGGGNVTSTSAYASPPGSPAAGDLWLPTDSHYTFRYSGAAWVPFRDGRALTLPPAAASWTWVNQGSATATDTGGAVRLALAAADVGDNLRLLVATVPTAPYVVTALLRVQTPQEGGARFGLCWRRNTAGIGSGRIALFGHEQNKISPVWGGFIPGLVSSTWSAPTVQNADYAAIAWPTQQEWWLRIADDNTDRVCSVSVDGLGWQEFDRQTRTDYFTPEQVGFYLNPAAASIGMAVLLLSWEVT